MRIILLFLFFWLTLLTHGKILRSGNHFFARFNLLIPNARITLYCTHNFTGPLTENECIQKCIFEEKCVSFNRHKIKGHCELLTVSKFDDVQYLQRHDDWLHYETDDDQQNIGSICEELSPCKEYEVCEDTFQTSSPYKCRCKDGFTGQGCKVYNGIGKTKKNPAASCNLLLDRIKSIPDGSYWFKGQTKKKPCARKDVDDNYTEWASWSSCNATIEEKDGFRERNRSCSNPTPRGTGSCRRLGLAHEIKACTNAHMFFANTFEAVKRNRTIGTIEKWRKEYTVKLVMKVPTVDQLINNKWYTVLRLTNVSTDYGMGSRLPAVFFQYGTTISNLYVGCIVNDVLVRTYLRLPPSDFLNPTNIEITQRLQGTEYIYQVIMNNKVRESQINKKPMEYYNVRIYAGGHHYQPTGVIKDLFIQEEKKRYLYVSKKSLNMSSMKKVKMKK